MAIKRLKTKEIVQNSDKEILKKLIIILINKGIIKKEDLD